MCSTDMVLALCSGECEKKALCETSQKLVVEGGKVEFPDGRDPTPFDGKIIECSYNEDKDTWAFLRERLDKSTPNGYNVYEKVGSLVRLTCLYSRLVTSSSTSVNSLSECHLSLQFMKLGGHLLGAPEHQG